MYSLAHQIFLFALLQITTWGERLSEDENADLQKLCGKFQNFTDPFSLKSHGGRELELFELPYVAYLSKRQKSFPDWYSTCSGTVISSRHLLTAAHCVVDTPDHVNYANSSEKKFHYAESLLVSVGSDCLEPKKCNILGRVRYYGKKVFLPYEFDKLHRFADIAIVEFNRDFYDHLEPPACLAKNDTIIKKTVHLAGYGKDRSRNHTNHLQMIHLQKVWEGETNYYRGLNSNKKAQSTEIGDSGAGGTQLRKDKRVEIIGVHSGVEEKHPDMRSIETDWLAIQVDIRRHSDWICYYSGVCVDKHWEQVNPMDIAETVIFEPEPI